MYSEIKINSSQKGLKAYEYACEDPKVILCCIHGIGEHFGRYERMAGYLNAAGIDMIGMDLRGHGTTEGTRGHCAPRIDVLSDIDRMIEYAMEKYAGIPIVVYGHSMGGNIGLDYRYRGRLNGVPCAYVISAPWVHLVKPVSGGLLGLVKILSKIVPKLTIGSDVDEAALGNPEFVRPYVDDPLVHNKVSAQTAYEGFSIGNAIYDGKWEKKGAGCERPLLLMHGDSDMVCDVDGSRKVAKLEGEPCEYIEWKNHYHEIHNGGPDSTGEEVILKMRDWILGTALKGE